MTAAEPIKSLSFPPDLTTIVQVENFDLSAAAYTTMRRGPHANSHRPQPAAPDRIASLRSTPYSIDKYVNRISFDTPSLAPMAFVQFCVKYPRDCETRHMPFRPRPITLGSAQMAELSRVNREVNRAIMPQANNDGVTAEKWLVSPRAGDCNDYAVTKRHELLAQGWPSRTLLLAEVVIPSGEHHLVLVVRTRENDLVLDNLNSNVEPVSQVRYRWIRAQQEKNPKFWSTINVGRAARVAMNAR